ncbi:MAG: tRNA (N6-isopentenyl adenosine(37)-C2)-methylthiotransferase MiaB [Phycisphaerae bacterium]|nr:tRNA (N6-isopentenyl adenosine(37)-C2)-methylthiotransferase MiaB [Phycisphaerae bacterium]
MSETRRYFLETFGCQMNILDSQLVTAQLHQLGLSSTDNFVDADVVLFNTCSVRQHAEDKVHARLGELKKHKQARPEMVVGVIGCMAEREKEGVFAKAPHVDLLCGPGELNQIPNLLREVWERNERVTALAGSLSRRTETLQRALEYDSLEALDLARAPSLEGNVLQSYVRVQRGCDKFCTYCVVPFTRGPERSRPPAHIVAEARQLVERGCRELTLLGQTVNSYVHQEDGEPVRFAQLLEQLHAVEGLDRIRFVTSYPADWDEDIFRVLRDYPRVMPYLHIPAQSGSDRVLKRMKRGYTAASYRKLMDLARHYRPDVALAGDVIVGFCGETDEEFRETIELVRAVEYQQLYIFRYSPRPGTAADRNLTDDISDELKAARNAELLAVQGEIGRKLRQRWVGQSARVLVEGFSKAARKARGETKGALRTRGKASPTFRVPPSPRAASSSPADSLAAAGEVDELRDLPQSEQDRGSEVGRERSDQLVGRTEHDLLVHFDAPPEYIGAIVEVQIETATAQSLSGRVIGVVSAPRLARASLPVAVESASRGSALPILQ